MSLEGNTKGFKPPSPAGPVKALKRSSNPSSTPTPTPTPPPSSSLFRNGLNNPPPPIRKRGSLFDLLGRDQQLQSTNLTGGGGGARRSDQSLLSEDLQNSSRDKRLVERNDQVPLRPSKTFGNLRIAADTTTRSDDTGYCSTTRSFQSNDSDNKVTSDSFYCSWIQKWSKANSDDRSTWAATDACFIQNDNLAVADPRNGRVKIFNAQGKSLEVLGPASSDAKTAQSFRRGDLVKGVHPTGLCYVDDSGILAVTNHDNLMIVDCGGSCKELLQVVPIKNATFLYGIAVELSINRLILTEIGLKPWVGVLQNGRIVTQFKGHFVEPRYVSWNNVRKMAAVSDRRQRDVFLYDSSTGKIISSIRATTTSATTGDDDDDRLESTEGVAWLNDGNQLLLADVERNSVKVYDCRNLNKLVKLIDVRNPVIVNTNKTENRMVLVTEKGSDSREFRLKMFEKERPA